MAELKKILSDLHERIMSKQLKRQSIMETLANAFLPEPKSVEGLRNALNSLGNLNSEILTDLTSIINFIAGLDKQMQSNQDIAWAVRIITQEKDLFETIKSKFFSKHISMYGDMEEVRRVLELRELIESVKKLNVLVGNIAVLSKLRVRFEKESESEKYLLPQIIKAISKAA